MSILDDIVVSKRAELAGACRDRSLAELEDLAANAPLLRDFRGALSGRGPIRLIAEIKKASPSAHVIRTDFEPISVARTYQDHGATCLSVLTDAPFFQGNLGT